MAAITKGHPWPDQLLCGLHQLQRSLQLCDASIITSAGHVPCHANVLKACVPQLQMQGSPPYLLQFPSLDPAVIAAVVEFVYTGELKCDDKICNEVHKVAKCLGLTALADASRIRHLQYNSAAISSHGPAHNVTAVGQTCPNLPFCSEEVKAALLNKPMQGKALGGGPLGMNKPPYCETGEEPMGSRASGFSNMAGKDKQGSNLNKDPNRQSFQPYYAPEPAHHGIYDHGLSGNMNPRDESDDGESSSEEEEEERFESTLFKQNDDGHFVCNLCNKVIKTKGALTYHRLKHDGPDEWRHECKECGRKFIYPWQLTAHERKHRGDNPFKCPDCPKAYSDKGCLKKHIKSCKLKQAKQSLSRIKVPVRTPVKVPISPRGFNVMLPPVTGFLNQNRITIIPAPTRPLGNVKLPIKRKEKKYTCSHCNRVLNHFGRFKIHVASHKPKKERPHKCETCGEGFALEYLLNNHRQKHTRDKAARDKAPCPHCGVCFSNEAVLKVHISSKHTDPDNIICEYCGEKYTKQRELNKHILSTHQNQKKSFECPYCDKAFLTKNGLGSHIRVHNKESQPQTSHKETPPEFSDIIEEYMQDIAEDP